MGPSVEASVGAVSVRRRVLSELPSAGNKGKGQEEPVKAGFLSAAGKVVAAAAAPDQIRVVTTEELAKHSQPGDAWIAIRNKVYDISSFVKDHPGGPVILTYAGKDATDVFTAFHDGKTWNQLPGLCIGEYKATAPTAELVKDFRELKAEMQRKGLFTPSAVFYTYKVSTTLMLWGAALAITFFGRHQIAPVLLGGFLLGIFWQQCGWLAHDFLHNQVFRNRSLNNIVGGYFLGNIAQGFSMSWWKFKHNTHHAAPNECDEEYRPVDPDIDTVPFLAWSEGIMSTVQSKRVRQFLRYQRELFLPLLMFARLSWCNSSLSFVWSDVMPESKRAAEKVTIVLHYVWLLGFAFSVLPLPMAFAWLATAEVVGGALLGFVFVQSHNGMEVYTDEKDFFTAQIVSTRNVHDSFFNNWFSGGLNRQIEHHLFPTMPRHNFRKAASMVAALCAKHGLVYEDVDWSTGTGLVLQHLAKVAATA